MIQRFTCSCCGYKTLPEKPPVTYFICPICFWEDDAIQYADPDYNGGANRVSLKQAQQNYIQFGACEEEMKKNVRPPSEAELRDNNWKPY